MGVYKEKKKKKKRTNAFSAKHYEKRRCQLGKIGVVKKKHSVSTINNVNEISLRWKLFYDNLKNKNDALESESCDNLKNDALESESCDDLKKGALQSLKVAERNDVMLFLEWILDNYASRKRINIRQKFKHWRQLFRKYAHKVWPEAWRIEVNDYINGPLTELYDLDISTKEKPVANVDDVYLVQHHLWVHDTSKFPDERQRLQLALLILICAYTATRPGAVVYVPRNAKVMIECPLGPDPDCEEETQDIDITDLTPEEMEEIYECLLYKHVTLVLLDNPDGERDLLAMEVDLRFTKGHKRNYKRRIFCMYEVDNLIFDPTLLMITLGILDNAFLLEPKNVSDIYKLRVNGARTTMRLRWKTDWENKPIFRQAVPTADGIQTSKDVPLRYHTFLYYLQRLGFVTGMMKILNPYNIRRGSGEGVEANGTQGQLQQVMNHKDAGIFQAYINERIQCDVQAAFLGRPSADALLKSTSHMSRDVDPRAPTQLSESEVDELKRHPLIIELRERRDALSKEARMLHGTIKNAEAAGSVVYQLYKEANSDLENTKKSLKRSKRKESRTEFFDRIETEDARRQLSMLALGLKEEEWKPIRTEHNLPERKLVAEILCDTPSNLTPQGKINYRIRAIEALVSLSGKKEPPQEQKRDRDWGILPALEPTLKQSPTSTPILTIAPIAVTNKECIFCICKTGYRVQFCRPRKAREHVERQHLRFFRDDDLIPCPDPYCRSSGIVIFGHAHFKNHVATVHGCSLLPYSLH